MTDADSRKDYMKEYREKNRERINAKKREWYKKNREKQLLYQQRYIEKKLKGMD